MAAEAPTPRTHPVNLTADYPARSSRLLAFIALFLIKSLLLIPHFIVLFFVQILCLLVAILALVTIVITGEHPKGLFNFQVGALQWQMRVHAWFLSITDEYPPFRLFD